MPIYLIGLTGNIATGKSAVARMLAELGAHVIDADAEVHRLQKPGTPVYAAIVAQFGPGILRADGEIDRARLGALVFSNPAALARLEAIVHPAVNQEIEFQISNFKSKISNLKFEILNPIIVIEAIKLIETNQHKTCNALWVVTAPYQMQLERLMRTRKLSEAEARTRIEAQSPQADKIALADVVIDNSGSLEQTRRQVSQHLKAILSQR